MSSCVQGQLLLSRSTSQRARDESNALLAFCRASGSDDKVILILKRCNVMDASSRPKKQPVVSVIAHDVLSTFQPQSSLTQNKAASTLTVSKQVGLACVIMGDKLSCQYVLDR